MVQTRREAIYIRMEQPSLNKDGGHYNFPSIWNNVSRSRAMQGAAQGQTTKQDPCQQVPNAIWSFLRVIRSPVADESFQLNFHYFYPEFTSNIIIDFPCDQTKFFQPRVNFCLPVQTKRLFSQQFYTNNLFIFGLFIFI